MNRFDGINEIAEGLFIMDNVVNGNFQVNKIPEKTIHAANLSE